MADDSPVQMRIYTLTKRQYLLVFSVFFAAFAVALIIGATGPTVLQETSETFEMRTNSSKVPYQIASPSLSKLDQQLWLLARFKRKENDLGVSLTFDFNVTLLISGGVGDDGKSIDSNHERVLKCERSDCEDLVLFHSSYIDYEVYAAAVGFQKAESLARGVHSVAFVWKYYDTTFTHFELWFRFAFLMMSFGATCAFAIALRRFKFKNWTIEQKWMSLLLFLLCLYNGPLEPLKFLISSWVPGMLDGIFQATFLSGLLMFWLCTLHGIRESKRGIFTFYMIKIILMFFIWLSAVTLSSWQQYNELEDPGFNTSLDTKNFIGFRIFFYIVVGIYALYLLYLIIRATVELRNMPYYSIRLKFLLFLMSIVLAVSVAVMVVRFGNAILEPSYLTSPKTEYQNFAEFLAFYSLLNFSMFTMAFVYSPSRLASFDLSKDASRSLMTKADDTGRLFSSQAISESEEES
ncbi:transmembrane protein 181-like [Oscarella lobularis]|uniref:transmembrane protein 181-like n=1 Tax=Oscarella lobularis TaxID=121494 RepID=UPI0033143362